MMYYGPGFGGWGMTFMIIGNLLFWGLLIFVAVLVARYVRQGHMSSSQSAEVSPQQIAAQRFARGEITEEGRPPGGNEATLGGQALHER